MGRRRPGHRLLFLVVCLFIALALTGCGRANDRAVSDNSTITILHPGDERSRYGLANSTLRSSL